MTGALEEHIQYLSDGVRSELYRKAVGQVIRPGDVVADLGCGFGFLGLECLKAGAAKVWGIDESDAIEIARESVAKAGFADSYHCIRDSSFRAELPETVDVIICDHVGFFGVDYGIVNMLGVFRQRFLKPGGRIIPGKIQLVLAAISSPDCRKMAEAWTDTPMPGEFHWLREYGINTKYPVHLAPQDVCSVPQKLGAIDLSADNPDTFSFKVSLQLDRDCLIDGLGGWFECELAEGILMTNSPVTDGRIERYEIFLPVDQPVEAKAGDILDVALTIRHEREIITWSAQLRGAERRQRQSTWNSMILTKADLVERSDKPVTLNRMGRARRRILELADGQRTAQEIEEAILQSDPHLFSSETELRKMVHRELGWNAEL